MTNPAFKVGLVKIGLTMRTPEERRRELASTGVPLPFVVEFAKRVFNPAEKEKCLHSMLEDKRINADREFFFCPVAEVRALFEMYEGPWWETPKDERQEARQEERQREHRVERERERELRRKEKEADKKERARVALERATASLMTAQALKKIQLDLEERKSQIRKEYAAKSRELHSRSLFTDEE
jgi:hypothetical protein